MATEVQTVHRPLVRESRAHDHIYDPHYMVSGERDHALANQRALAANTKMKRLPIYNAMFSEMRNYPRLELRADMRDPVPPFVPRHWAGLNNYTTYEDPQVDGTNRYKYARRPLISLAESSGSRAVLASDRQTSVMWSAAGGHRLGGGVERSGGSARGGGALSQQQLMMRASVPLLRTTQTQTDYRESEAQTDPYAPDYVVRPGTHPEILSLALLSYGHGLPAGLAEVEMIERAREKRAWEATLPPLSDSSQHARRRAMMEEQQRKEWAQREHEIETLQEERLQVLTLLLKQREEKHQELNNKRLDKLWGQEQEKKTEIVNRIRSEYIRMIRKLTRKSAAVEGRLKRTTAVDQYTDFGSQAYAPLTRIGVFRDRNSERYAVRSGYLGSYDGLCELEISMPEMFLPAIKPPRRKSATVAGFTKRKYKQEKELADIHNRLLADKQRLPEGPRKLKFLEKIERPPPRPATPSVQGPTEEEEQREVAVIYLQAALRGRSVQNAMFEGVARRRELIGELRSTHALQQVGQQAVAAAKLALLRQQQQQEQHQHKESSVDAALAVLEGGTVGDTLDYLAKELIRLQEERRIHAFTILAERDRRLREAEEAGLRQAEERVRREEDEMFRQVVKVHQDSVDVYLQDIILSAVGRVADEQAREEIEEMSRKVNEIAFEAENRRTSLESQEICAELVHSFLLPEVKKQSTRDNMMRHQKKFLLAAHKEIMGLEEVLSAVPIPAPTQTGSSPENMTTSSRPQSVTENAGSKPGSTGKIRCMDDLLNAMINDDESARPEPVVDKVPSRPTSKGASSRSSSARLSSRAEENDDESSRPTSELKRPDITTDITEKETDSRPCSTDKRRSSTTKKSSKKEASRPESATQRSESKTKDRSSPGDKTESGSKAGLEMGGSRPGSTASRTSRTSGMEDVDLRTGSVDDELQLYPQIDSGLRPGTGTSEIVASRPPTRRSNRSESATEKVASRPISSAGGGGSNLGEKRKGSKSGLDDGNSRPGSDVEMASSRGSNKGASRPESAVDETTSDLAVEAPRPGSDLDKAPSRTKTESEKGSSRPESTASSRPKSGTEGGARAESGTKAGSEKGDSRAGSVASSRPVSGVEGGARAELGTKAGSEKGGSRAGSVASSRSKSGTERGGSRPGTQASVKSVRSGSAASSQAPD